jgi:hypothetical protein
MKSVITSFLLFFSCIALAQEVVPTAKTKADRKADRKKMTLEEKIEDILPVDVTLPSASLRTPKGEIKSVDQQYKGRAESQKKRGKKESPKS